MSETVRKYIIVEDSQKSREFFKKQDTPFTFVAFVKDFPSDFQTAMELYDHRVTYMTLTSDHQISVIVNDPQIADMHRKQFEYLWKSADGAPMQHLHVIDQDDAPKSASEHSDSPDPLESE